MPQPDFDHARFITALTRHQPALEAFCHAQLANRHDAQEALQVACVKLWEKAADWDPNTEFLPWAFTVTRFTILAHRRDQMRERLVFDEDVVLAMAQEIETTASEFDDRREALGECMQKLKPEHRGILHEHYLVGRTLREIASEAQRSESAVKMTLVRLRQQLGECIQNQLHTAL